MFIGRQLKKPDENIQTGFEFVYIWPPPCRKNYVDQQFTKDKENIFIQALNNATTWNL